MAFSLLNDDDIQVEIGKQIDIIRRKKKMSTVELAEKSGVGTATLTRIFNGTGNTGLKTLISVLRGLDALDKLEVAFVQKINARPFTKSKVLKKRIFKKSVTPRNKFQWGDDVDE